MSERFRPNVDVCKVLAILTMVIDHLGCFLAPQAFGLRLVGRLAFPLFACCLGYNFVHHTRDQSAYIRRLLWAAVVAQPIYALTVDTWRLNIFLTLGLGLWLVKWSDRSTGRFALVMVGLMLLFCVEAMAGVRLVSYGALGLAAVMACVYERWVVAAWLFGLANALGMLTAAPIVAGLWAAFSAVGVCLFVLSRRFDCQPGHWIRSRLLWYSFYPVHLFLIWMMT